MTKRVCFLTSSGGHLAQLNCIKDVVKKDNRFFITVPSKDSLSSLSKEKVYYTKLRTADWSKKTTTHVRSNLIFSQIIRVFLVIRMFFDLMRIILKEKFDYVITAGASAGLFFCFFSWILGKKIILIETYANPKDVTRFGKLVHIISYKTFVQWPAHSSIHKNSILIPPLYNNLVYDSDNFNSSIKFVYVSVGSTQYQFNRLLKELDRIKDKTKLKFIAQIGHSNYEPSFFFKKTFHKENHMRLMKNCNIYITHGGSSSVWDSTNQQIKTIIVPRLSKFGEHIDDHQVNLAEEFKKSSGCKVVYSIENLLESLTSDFNLIKRNSEDKSSIGEIRNYII